jgi:hypothetical protein
LERRQCWVSLSVAGRRVDQGGWGAVGRVWQCGAVVLERRCVVDDLETTKAGRLPVLREDFRAVVDCHIHLLESEAVAVSR